MFYSPDNEHIAYMGRNDLSHEGEARLYYAGSQIMFSFKGTYLKLKISGMILWGEVSLGVIIDGERKKLPLSAENNNKEVTLTAAESLPDTVHSVIIYKKQAACHYLVFKGIETDGELATKPALPDLKIEVYGDSVCAGEVIEAEEFAGKPDPEGHNSRYDDVWNSFVMQTARNLNAQIHNIAQGGLSLFDGSGFFHMPDTMGLETVYNKTCFFPEAGELTNWDFSRYIPDIVIIAIAQNDHHDAKTDTREYYTPAVPEYRARWKDAYKKIVRDLDGKYGKPKFVLTTTILCHSKDWDDAIEEITRELNEEGIKAYHNLFTRNGSATPGHPRLSEHNEMAGELTSFIKNNVL